MDFEEIFYRIAEAVDMMIEETGEELEKAERYDSNIECYRLGAVFSTLNRIKIVMINAYEEEAQNDDI